MVEFMDSILAQSLEHLNIVLLMGLAIFFGTAGAGVFRKLRIPMVVGYVTIGIILGPMLKIFSEDVVQTLERFNLFALGVIGFLIGGELKREIFTKFGKQVAAILLFEGVAAFLLVTLLSFLALFCLFDWQTALAVGVVFGAICSATDPASTVNVLWEYKTRGPLTTVLTAIVALDDALAMILYIASVAIAGLLTGNQEGGFAKMAFESLWEVAGSLGLGTVSGLVLRCFIRRTDDEERTLVFTVGTVVLTTGLAISLKLDVILSCMTFGVVLVNLSPRPSLKSFELVRRFSPPIYVLFFVIIGARLNISVISWQIWLSYPMIS